MAEIDDILIWVMEEDGKTDDETGDVDGMMVDWDELGWSVDNVDG